MISEQDTFKIELTSDMIREQLMFPLDEIQPKYNSQYGYTDSTCFTIPVIDLEKRIIKQKSLDIKVRNYTISPKYRDFYNSMNIERLSSNALFRVNRYNIDHNILLGKKTQRIDIYGAWDFYSILSNLKQIREWKVWYETRRCINKDVPFDTRRVLEFTMTDLTVAIGGTYNWKSLYTQPENALGLKDYRREDYVNFDQSLIDVEKNIRMKVDSEIDFELLFGKITNIKRIVKDFREKSSGQPDYLIVSHGKTENWKGDAWRRANSLDIFSKINTGAARKRENALVLDLKVFDTLIDCLCTTINFDVEIKLKEKREKLLKNIRYTFNLLEMAAPFEEGHERYYPIGDWDSKPHSNSFDRHLSNARIKLRRIETSWKDLQRLCLSAFGSNKVDEETFVRMNAFRRAVKLGWNKTEQVLGEERMSELEEVDSALKEYTQAVKEYLSNRHNFEEEEKLTYGDIKNCIEVLSSPYNGSTTLDFDYTILTERQWKQIDHDTFQDRMKIITDALNNSDLKSYRESVLQQKYRESLDTAGYIQDKSKLFMNHYERCLIDKTDKIDSHVKFVKKCKEHMWMRQIEIASGPASLASVENRDSDTLKGGSLVAKDTGSDANE